MIKKGWGETFIGGGVSILLGIYIVIGGRTRNVLIPEDFRLIAGGVFIVFGVVLMVLALNKSDVD